MRELPYPLPIQVICELFGVAGDECDELRRLFDSVFNTAADAEEVMATNRDLHAFLGHLVDVKRRAPADDMASGSIAARDEDGDSRLGEPELVDTLNLSRRGTRRPSTSSATRSTPSSPPRPARPGPYRRGAVGRRGQGDAAPEAERGEPPLRYAVEDIEVDGVVIRRGEAILASYAAAGRDPARHGPDADRFDITRPAAANTSPSATACTTASGRHSPGWKPRSPCQRCSPASSDLVLAVPPEQLQPVASFISHGVQSLPVLLRRASN